MAHWNGQGGSETYYYDDSMFYHQYPPSNPPYPMHYHQPQWNAQPSREFIPTMVYEPTMSQRVEMPVVEDDFRSGRRLDMPREEYRPEALYPPGNYSRPNAPAPFFPNNRPFKGSNINQSRSFLPNSASTGTVPKYNGGRQQRKPKQWNGNKNNNFSKDMHYKGSNSAPNTSNTWQDSSWRSSPQEKKLSWRSETPKQEEVSQSPPEFVTQRERLTNQLKRGTLECLVCYELVKPAQQIWSCTNCYHILHLKCIIKWASTSKGDNGWRCPACQNVTLIVPSEYRCMCGKMVDPPRIRGEVPHCCGQTCSRSSLCVHKCPLLCHPGPCPPCAANIHRSCGCGRTSQIVQCASTLPVICTAMCDKILNCGVHNCQEPCHGSSCAPCDKTIKQTCHCKLEEREVACDEEAAGSEAFSCGQNCCGTLQCGNHPCEEVCHPGECGPCLKSPDVIKTCPCGKKQINPEERESCLSDIPTCSSSCKKQLTCGQPGNKHVCEALCHLGPCPSCPLTTKVMCRCGFMEKEIPCPELTSNPDDARCQKRCTKKRSCGKHKCNQVCCIDIDHVCPLPCNKTLNCGRHRCQRLCHRGHCLPCTSASFDELHCECGKQIIFPPVPCGTRPPVCDSPCPRQHSCNHPPLHTCHSELECPPCTVLTSKYCHAKHELRKTVPCHVAEFSCGRPCGKPLSGCSHFCQKICHAGLCLEESTTCSQPCTEPRHSCDHPCAAPCHPASPCPLTPCSAQVKVTCQCGRRSATRTCSDNASEYRRIATSILASKMADVQLGLSVDTDLNLTSKMSLKTLECNDECKIYERNLRLAIGLQIVNPDLSNKLQPKYSDNMKRWAKKDTRLVQLVHDQLTQLVQLAKTSKQKNRSYSFAPMNWEKRQFVHEYCKHFGCESKAYDSEPKRNVVATAYKDKCWLPSYSLMEMIQRENGQRKVPLPSLRKAIVRDEQMETLPKSSSSTSTVTKTEEQKTPSIDYFDFTPSDAPG